MLQVVLLIARWIAEAEVRALRLLAGRRPLAAEIASLRERLHRVEAENDLLRARLQRLPSRSRPRYRPWERLAVLWHAARHRLPVAATARAFVVSPTTIINWRRDVAREARRLVGANPPINRLPDLVADLVHRLKREWPRWGTRRIAGILARLGLQASRTTVQRMLRRPPRRPAAAVRAGRRPRRALLAKHPGHIHFVDFTRIGGFFRSVVVGAFIDGFSRKVLALRVWPGEPPAAFAIRLVRQAIRCQGAPRWLVADLGTQFTAEEFGRFARRHGIRRRFGAVGKKGSIALIERFWRSMKQECANGILLFRSTASIERRLRAYAEWFNGARPHAGIGQRTPDEAHTGRSTRAASVPLRAALEVRLIGGDHALPVLSLRRAA